MALALSSHGLEGLEGCLASSGATTMSLEEYPVSPEKWREVLCCVELEDVGMGNVGKASNNILALGILYLMRDNDGRAPSSCD